MCFEAISSDGITRLINYQELGVFVRKEIPRCFPSAALVRVFQSLEGDSRKNHGRCPCPGHGGGNEMILKVLSLNPNQFGIMGRVLGHPGATLVPSVAVPRRR